MSLLQKALETYDSHFTYASEAQPDSVGMAPVGHIVTRADLEITLDAEGHFVDAVAVDKKEPKIIIPATEGSAGRTSAPCAHPLCEQLGYLLPENQEKYRLYTELLAAWEASPDTHPKLSAVLRYVRGGTVRSDLLRCGVIKEKPDEKLLIRWRVLGEAEPACWKDRTLFDAFTRFYSSNRTGEAGLCMVSGERAFLAEQHPKGVVASWGNAKLISANDRSGFTYRGRFTDERQAATVGYEASQKAHNALRWLVQEQGVNFGGRTFLCWNPQGRVVVRPTNPLLQQIDRVFQPSDYAQALRDALAGRKAKLKPTDGVVIAVFDAATTGRLALTYYNELMGHDFLERLYDWDRTCCWDRRPFGAVQTYGVQSPPLRMIADCAFGTQREDGGGARLETDERVLRQQMQRLIGCRVDRLPIGADLVKALAERASDPMAYDGKIRENILFTACAVIRKYRFDRFKEEWSMALETERKDRSYQFGRLLAVMEKAERDAYRNGEEREPNAIRLQSVFCRRPRNTAYQLQKQLDRAYLPRLRPSRRTEYRRLIGQIIEQIDEFPDGEQDKPLGDTYLMGYYLQRNELYRKKNKDIEEELENG